MGRYMQHRLVPDPMMCSVSGCDRQAVSRSLCAKHYQRWLANGDPLKTKITERGVIDAWLAAHVGWADQNECLMWPFSSSGRKSRPKNRYPVAGKRRAHAVMCELAHGARPSEKSVVAHSCDNPMCVNPHHLRWATHEENMRDMVLRGRSKQGEAHEKAKLTVEAVRIIRQTPRGYGVTKALSERFGVKTGTINSLWRGDTWKGVPQ